MVYAPQPHNDSFWGEIWESVPYFFSHSRRAFIAGRQKLWLEHVNTYARLKHGTNTDPDNWGTTRVDFLTLKLDIIDRKFSAILQFQGLLAIAVSIGLAVFRDSLTLSWLLESLVALFFLFWFGTFLISIRAVGRLFWGDMWKEEATAVKEERHTRLMIICVIRRTARYRIAVLLAILTSVTLLLLLITVCSHIKYF